MRRLQPVHRLCLLAALAVVSIVMFLVVGAKGNWDFVLAFRGAKILALATVAAAVATSTVLFQTISQNRILTPSIMGFDSLYVLIQTALFFFFGAAGFVAIDPRLLYAVNVVTMVLFSMILYRSLIQSRKTSLHLMILVGVVLGIFFRSISSFIQRIIDPDEFVVLQDRLFASFNIVNQTLLWATMVVIAIAFIVIWRLRFQFDAASLGRDMSIGVGLDHARLTNVTLVLVSLLVSASTALVGPVMFFGLLTAHIAYQTAGTHRHAFVIPAAILYAVILLIGGQTILERVFGLDAALSVIIDFVGGAFFIALLLRGSSR